MRLTGQPFVDVGMAIAAHLMERKSIRNLSSNDLRHSVSLLDERMKSLQKLKVLSAYWHNNPLAGMNLSKRAVYEGQLRSLSKDDVPTVAGVCQTCGYDRIYSDANRSWLPLAGSADSDPCSLPNLGSKLLCANCFRAILLLPMGCKFSKSGPYFFHLTDPDLQVEAISEATQTIDTVRLARASGIGSIRTKTTLSGRLELLELVSGSRLWDQTQGGIFSRKAKVGATIIAFNNSGTRPVFNELRLPAQALEFFAALWERSHQRLFLKWAKDSKAKFFDHLCDDIETRRSIAPIVAALVRSRKVRVLSKDEKEVLQMYEDLALEKSKRFETLMSVAARINRMDTMYRDSLVKQLGNTRSKGRLLELLKEFAKSEKTNLRLSSYELRIIAETPPSESINLLYLLCVAEQ